MTDSTELASTRELEAYSSSLAALETAAHQATVDLALNVLVARDRVRLALQQRPPISSAELLQLQTLDERLRKQTGTICALLDLPAWRATVQPHPDAWWWFLQPPAQLHWSVRFSWVWNAAIVLWLIVTLFLIFDMVPRFPDIGPDTMNTLVKMTQLAIGILAAGGALTLAGRKLIDNFLLGIRLPKQYLPEAKLALALVALGLLLLLRFSLADFARFYNNRAVLRHQAGEITAALQDYERALKLAPNFVEVHYNLGLLYEDLGDYTRAQAEYRLAVEGNLDIAYVNLSRLYILDGKYAQAALLLERHLADAVETDVRYDLLKNLGWARLGQGRYSEAATHLQQAVALASNQAAAHCLLAQTYEGREQHDLALDEWEQCLALASVLRTEEDTWIGMARARLAAE